MSPEPPLQDHADVGGTAPPEHGGTVRALPRGTRLQEFEIIGLVGEGGFGVVYLAHDHSLERRVAVKEYLPWTLATRDEETGTVTVKSKEELETFSQGLKSFLNEARLLAQFDHPSLVKVHRFWEANGTAYMAMPFYEGPTLLQALTARSDPPDEAWLRRLLAPLLDALAVMHAGRCFHRDIAPDNILLTPAGPLLLDLGAARRAISEASQTFTAILKEGYAPAEQYAASSGPRQGPWTDIYALCGVVRYAITGVKPDSAIDRLLVDRMAPLSQIAAGRYSGPFLRAIDAGMAVKPEDRPQDISQLRALMDVKEDRVASLLGATLIRPASRPKAARPLSSPPETQVPGNPRSGNLRWTLGALLAVGLLVAGYLYLRQSLPASPGPTRSWRRRVIAADRPARSPPVMPRQLGAMLHPVMGPVPVTRLESPRGDTVPPGVHLHEVTRVPAGVGQGFPHAEDYYPQSAQRAGQTGKTDVRVCVNPSGRLTEAPTVARSSGFPSLDRGALQLARDGSGHYRPAMQDGHPVSSCFVLGVRFSLH